MLWRKLFFDVGNRRNGFVRSGLGTARLTGCEDAESAHFETSCFSFFFPFLFCFAVWLFVSFGPPVPFRCLSHEAVGVQHVVLPVSALRYESRGGVSVDPAIGGQGR